MNKPLVSCICPTYNRYPQYGHLLEECVYWFNQQDYENRELIILNDCTEQTLICNSPKVRVINEQFRYKSLGEKYNAMLDYSNGEIILPWEDDDISLPNRISQAVRILGDECEYFNPQHSWFDDGTVKCDHLHGVCHNASAYKKLPQFKYQNISGPQDMYFDTDIKKIAKLAPTLNSDPNQWTYVYRWGVSDIHLSAFHDTEGKYKSGHREIISGTYEIIPTMKKNYIELCQI